MTEHYCGDHLRPFNRKGLRCVVCGGPDPRPKCPHGCGPLRWVDDSWYCPKCGDEWGDEIVA